MLRRSPARPWLMLSGDFVAGTASMLSAQPALAPGICTKEGLLGAWQAWLGWAELR